MVDIKLLVTNLKLYIPDCDGHSCLVFLIVPLVGILQLSIAFLLGYDGVSLGNLSQIFHIFKQPPLLRPLSWKFLPPKFQPQLFLQVCGNRLPKRTGTSTRGLWKLKDPTFFFLTNSSIFCKGEYLLKGCFFFALSVFVRLLMFFFSSY